MQALKDNNVMDNTLFFVERDAAEKLATDAFRGRTGDLQKIYAEHLRSAARSWGFKNKIAPADILKILGVTDEV